MEQINKQQGTRTDCLYYKLFGICDLQVISRKKEIACENVIDCKNYHPLKYRKLEVKVR
jgi:hypothetical protein